MRASTSASALISCARQASAGARSAPFICRNACRRWPCVSAATRSARPSTAVRSSLPFSKARRVNSPASAGLRPSMPRKRAQHRGDHRAAAMQLQLGHVLAGLAMGRRKPQDERLVDDLMGGRIADAGERGFSRLGDFAGRIFSASPARGPEMRTTAIAAGPRPEERAKMVGRYVDIHGWFSASPAPAAPVLRGKCRGPSRPPPWCRSDAPQHRASRAPPVRGCRPVRLRGQYLDRC